MGRRRGSTTSDNDASFGCAPFLPKSRHPELGDRSGDCCDHYGIEQPGTAAEQRERSVEHEARSTYKLAALANFPKFFNSAAEQGTWSKHILSAGTDQQDDTNYSLALISHLVSHLVSRLLVSKSHSRAIGYTLNKTGWPQDYLRTEIRWLDRLVHLAEALRR